MRYKYSIKVNFAQPSNLKIILNENIYYGIELYDILTIDANKILIQCERSKKKNIVTSLSSFNSTFDKQINKALTFLATTEGFIPTIKNVEIISYDLNNKIIDCHSIDKINQPFNSTLLNELKWDLTDAKILLQETPLSHTLLLATVYWLKAQDYKLEGGKFEKHWKSFNTMYTFISQKDKEFDKLVSMKDFIWNNPSLFPKTMITLSGFTTDNIRKLRIREMILNDYGTENSTKAYADFIQRYEDYRINQVFKATLPYREKFLISRNLYRTVVDSIEKSIAQNNSRDEQLLTFYLIKYAYFIRNKYFHAERIDSTFYLISNAEIQELSHLNKLFSLFLKELLVAHNNY